MTNAAEMTPAPASPTLDDPALSLAGQSAAFGLAAGCAPFFRNQWCAIYHGDSRELLPSIPRESFDLLLTDPPYGIKFVSGGRKDSWGPIIGDDGTLDVYAVLSAALKCCHDGAHLYVFGSFDLAKITKTQLATLVWDKAKMGIGGSDDSPWSRTHEPIQFATNGRFASQAKKGGLVAKKRRGSVLRVMAQNGNGCTRHPTEKPVELLRQLIEASSVMGDSVLDPFMGAGSTLEAAHREGRYAVGIEIDERHCETAARRLEALGSLF